MVVAGTTSRRRRARGYFHGNLLRISGRRDRRSAGDLPARADEPASWDRGVGEAKPRPSDTFILGRLFPFSPEQQATETAEKYSERIAKRWSTLLLVSAPLAAVPGGGNSSRRSSSTPTPADITIFARSTPRRCWHLRKSRPTIQNS